MPVLDTRRAVKVCTTHFKVLDRGVWKTSKWSETMANRHDLHLVEDCCDRCTYIARRSFYELWKERYGEAHRQSLQPVG